MKLIDPKQAKEFASTFFGDPILKMAANAVLDNVPTIEAAPVVHGRWIPCGGDIHSSGRLLCCSACGRSVFVPNRRILAVTEDHYFMEPGYCPNPSCGAKMDGGPAEKEENNAMC